MPRKLDKKEAQRIAKLRWENISPEDRILHSLKMNQSRWYNSGRQGGSDTQ